MNQGTTFLTQYIKYENYEQQQLYLRENLKYVKHLSHKK